VRRSLCTVGRKKHVVDGTCACLNEIRREEHEAKHVHVCRKEV
jgi:hypothetical protein